MKWQSMAGYGTVSIFLLIGLITNLSGVSNISYTNDLVCAEECEAYINFTTTYWEFCFEHGGEKDLVYKKMTRSHRLWVNMDKVDQLAYTEPEIKVDILVPARGKGNWRDLKEGDCLKRTTKANPLPVRLKLIGHKSQFQTVKWSFTMDSVLSQEIDIDPLWIGYEPVRENLSRTVDTYDYKLIEKKGICAFNTTLKDTVCTSDYNYTIKIKNGTRINYYEGKEIGLKILGKEYIGQYYVVDQDLIHWTVPIGDRNMEEFGNCLPYELEKGVCFKRSLT